MASEWTDIGVKLLYEAGGPKAVRKAVNNSIDAAIHNERAVKHLPVCPKCQQGYVCEHCGEPIGDYYAASAIRLENNQSGNQG